VEGFLSFKAQQWVLEQEDVKGVDKWVLFVLAFRDNHDEPHGCYPSFNRMAKDCGLDRRTIIRVLNRLEVSGKIASSPRKKVNGDPSSNYYSFPQVWKVVEKKVVAHGHQGSGTRGKRVVAQRHPNLLKTLTKREPSRSALPELPPEEQKQFQNNFLATMRKIMGDKSL
jgi:hypothetical protein